MLAVVAPGQGSQTPGFITPWLEVPGYEERLRWLSTVAGLDLVKHGTDSDADTIRDTAVAQPLLVGAGLVTLLSLFPHPAEAYGKVGVGAGHSVGEITAAVGAGQDCSIDQGRVVGLDSRDLPLYERFRVAGWIQCVHGKPIGDPVGD